MRVPMTGVRHVRMGMPQRLVQMGMAVSAGRHDLVGVVRAARPARRGTMNGGRSLVARRILTASLPHEIAWNGPDEVFSDSTSVVFLQNLTSFAYKCDR